MIDSRITIGLIAALIAMATLAYVGIQEQGRMARFETSQKAKSISTGAVIFEQSCSPCHNTDGTGIPGRGPALNSEHFFNGRLEEIGYQGTLESYVNLTVASGRPVRTTGDYAQSMPTWSQEYGGPLRQDQVRDVVAFIMNWELEDRAGVSAESAAVDDPVARGQSLFNSSGCAACHLVQGVSSGVVGPELTNVFADKGADYIRDSILNPNAAIAEGYTENVMPATLADQLSDADIDDIIAFLENAAQ